MEYRLAEPSPEMEQAYIDYITEWENAGEEIVPYASRRDNSDFKHLLNRWKSEASDAVRAKGLVPATLYFLIDEGGRIYGAVHVRHELNEYLLKYGGHIGYGIRPSERKKGIGAVMLSLVLPTVKRLGIDKVLVTCDKGNLASAKTILKNGGILENEVSDGNSIVQRYWIQL